MGVARRATRPHRVRAVREAPALTRAQRRHEALHLRLCRTEMNAWLSREDLLVDLAEAGHYRPDPVYRMLTPADQRLLAEAREARKAAQIPWWERSERVATRAAVGGETAAASVPQTLRDRLAGRAAKIARRSSAKKSGPPSPAPEKSKDRDRGPGLGWDGPSNPDREYPQKRICGFVVFQRHRGWLGLIGPSYTNGEMWFCGFAGLRPW